MNRSFRSRMAALEALESAADAERQSLDDDGAPDLAELDDAEVLWQATQAIRSHALIVTISAPLGQVTLTLSGYRAERWRRWYRDLQARAQPLFDALPKPLILLAPWEVEETIAAIDEGHVAVVSQHGVYFGLCLDALSQADDDLVESVRAVNWAHDFICRQRYCPQPRNFHEPREMATLDEWRQWLIRVQVGK